MSAIHLQSDLKQGLFPLSKHGDTTSPLLNGRFDSKELLCHCSLQRSNAGGHGKIVQSQPSVAGIPIALMILERLALVSCRYVHSSA
jgi:hypothetical protein